jgi:hypothetical protein
MSEYGCITNGRTFQEVAALYNTEMTGVNSGGLVYEYSEEGNGYGLVTISGSSVVPNGDFTALQSAFAAATNPAGLGGATTTSGSATTCPTESLDWDVAGDTLPAIPSAALAYGKTGAGAGPGLAGPGSQEAGDSENESAGTATPGSGAVTATATSASSSSTTTKKSAAGGKAQPFDFQAVGIMATVLISGFLGVAIL